MKKYLAVPPSMGNLEMRIEPMLSAPTVREIYEWGDLTRNTPGLSQENIEAAVAGYLLRGANIEAIKFVRAVMRMQMQFLCDTPGLKEANEAVDDFERTLYQTKFIQRKIVG